MTARLISLCAMAAFPTLAFAEDIQRHPGLTYATHGGEELKLDLTVPAGEGPFPLIVYIHGGGWREGNRAHAAGAVEGSARRGFAAATVSYRFTPRHAWPAQREDVQAAVRWLRANAKRYAIDPRRVGAAGWSAGGHLSLMLGLLERGGADDAGVDAVVNFFGPTDMTTDVFNDFVDKIFLDLAGGTREDRAAAYRDFSPVAHVSRGDAPVLTFQGTKDELVPVDQARVLHRALDAAGVSNRLEILEGRGHGWGGEDGVRTQNQTLEFFDTYLRGSDLPLVAAEDFSGDAGGWEPTEPGAWRVEAAAGRRAYRLGKPQATYAPGVRSPLHISLLKGVEVEDFVLDVDLRSTVKDYGHRDLCVFFGHQDPTHFYYVHVAKAADPRAHSVFIVDGKDRASIAVERTPGVEWGDGWHRLRVKRDAASGAIEVFFDDMSKPIMKASDRTFPRGRVGLGSFDDQGDFTTFRLRGKAAGARSARL